MIRLEDIKPGVPLTGLEPAVIGSVVYTLCERLRQAEGARAYNELIPSWTSIEFAAATAPRPAAQELPGFER